MSKVGTAAADRGYAASHFLDLRLPPRRFLQPVCVCCALSYSLGVRLLDCQVLQIFNAIKRLVNCPRLGSPGLVDPQVPQVLSPLAVAKRLR